jgi:hypothetical protein
MTTRAMLRTAAGLEHTARSRSRGGETPPPAPRVDELVACVRQELLAAGAPAASPALDVRVERIVDVVSRFVLDWVES